MTLLRKPWLLALACLIPAAVPARPLAEMAATGDFVICAAPDEMPFSARATPPTGLFVDLGRLVADDLGLTLAVRWVQRRELAHRAGCDAIMGAAVVGDAEPAGPTSWRSVRTTPYMHAGTVMIAGARVGRIAALDGFRERHVAVPSGSWAHKYLNDRGIPVWVRFRTDPEIIDAVASGAADGGVVSDLAANWYRLRHPDAGIQVLDGLLDAREFGFDVAIDLLDTDQAVLDRVNGIVKARLADGAIAAIGRRYGGYRPPAGTP